ncbi:unnamed protein product [Protopolystoma xenopodis]|uniref:Uncharacterized protein n=1 Tax=Protopolystoma xenopodis TaxID=117903 RepID=A0A3S5B301_9PLAT|nr:unnamed protein product [Protopolystoma xenopodis]
MPAKRLEMYHVRGSTLEMMMDIMDSGLALYTLINDMKTAMVGPSVQSSLRTEDRYNDILVSDFTLFRSSTSIQDLLGRQASLSQPPDSSSASSRGPPVSPLACLNGLEGRNASCTPDMPIGKLNGPKLAGSSGQALSPQLRKAYSSLPIIAANTFSPNPLSIPSARVPPKPADPEVNVGRVETAMDSTDISPVAGSTLLSAGCGDLTHLFNSMSVLLRDQLEAHHQSTEAEQTRSAADAVTVATVAVDSATEPIGGCDGTRIDMTNVGHIHEGGAAVIQSQKPTLKATSRGPMPWTGPASVNGINTNSRPASRKEAPVITEPRYLSQMLLVLRIIVNFTLLPIVKN